MTRIYLVRHGQSVGNLKRVVAGHIDVDLTPLGLAQAEETARYLKDVPFTHIYSSSLLRARKTAIPHLSYHNVPITYLDELKEINCGVWENIPRSQLEGKDEQYDLFWSEFGTCVIPGGDSVAEAGVRFRDEVISLACKHPDQTILIVTHAAFLRCMIGTVLGIALDEYEKKLPFPTNASVQIMDWDGESLSLVAFSEDAHITNKTAIRK